MSRVEVTIDGSPCRLMTQDLASWLSISGRDPNSFNRLMWPGGAGRWAQGTFLMLDSDLPSNLKGEKKIIFKSPGDDFNDVKIGGMYFGHIRPLSKRGPQTLFEVQMYDERYHWQFKDIAEIANITVESDRETLFTTKKDTSWDTLLENVLEDLGVLGRTAIETPGTSVNPPDMQFFSEPGGITVDRICSALGCAFTASFKDGAPSYGIKPYAAHSGQILNLLENDHVMSGGVTYDSTKPEGKATLNRVMPSEVKVLFPRTRTRIALGLVSTTGMEENQYYDVTVSDGRPSGTSGISGTKATIYDTMYAIGVIDSETNTSEMSTRASELSSFFFARYEQPKGNAVLSGFHGGFDGLGGMPGTIEWIYHPDGPLTVVDAPEDWYAHGLDRDIDGRGFHDMNIGGLDGHQAIRDPAGGIRIGMHQQQLFLVKLEKDGGIEGPASTWTYKLTDINDVELATGITPERVRDATIKYTFAPTGSFGLAFIDPTTDAVGLLVAFEEIEQSNECT